MSPPDPPLPDYEFLEAFEATLQADENDEAVYGWMVEEAGDSVVAPEP